MGEHYFSRNRFSAYKPQKNSTEIIFWYCFKMIIFVCVCLLRNNVLHNRFEMV